MIIKMVPEICVTLLLRSAACETKNRASAISENNLPIVYYSAKLLNITVRVADVLTNQERFTPEKEKFKII